MNENIKHLRQIIENCIPAETTSGQPSPTLAEAQVVLDLLEVDLRDCKESMRLEVLENERLRQREKPEIRGLLHTVVKWINAGHMIPNDDGAMSLHADPKRATAAKMGMRLAQGAWLHAANKAVEPHENTATPMLDPALSNLAEALTWMYGNVSRIVCMSHGGPGGKWYVRLEDEDGECPSDAANDDITTAIGDAMCGMEATP